MQFTLSGTVYTQIEIELNNQSYSTASATAESRHIPLLWEKTKYCIMADMNLKYQDHCLFSALP